MTLRADVRQSSERARTKPQSASPLRAGPLRPARHDAVKAINSQRAAGSTPEAAGASSWAQSQSLSDLLAYNRDLSERSILFLDVLRQRGDNMLAHERAGKPPVLDFDYELISDAHRFERPANYALLCITRFADECLEDCLDPEKPPLIIVDPRAGHGPGIGGFKRDSEVGIALHEGYPTYFVMFFPEPCPGQTLADVLHALRRFVEHVAKRHGDKAPILYGNCQAGWAVTLLAADCQGLAGPAILNGSPLSYWGGESGVNPARMAGPLTRNACDADIMKAGRSRASRRRRRAERTAGPHGPPSAGGH